jgi:hypothetical protein
MAGSTPFRRQRRAFVLLLALAGVMSQLSFASAEEPLPARVRGTIEAVEGRLITLKAREGETLKIRLTETARIGALVPATLADVKTGGFVGITSLPDENGNHKALEVHIFPESLRGTGEGQRPWDLGPKTTMTNGAVQLRVDQVAGPELTLQFKTGAQKIQVTPETVIVAYAAAEPGDLKPGNKAILFGLKRADDGIIEAAVISIGRDGLLPPM